MSFNPREPLSGTYRIVSKADTEDGAIYTLSRSGEFQTVKVAHTIVKSEIPDGSAFEPSTENPEGPVFEIRKDSQFTTPVLRLAEEGELAEIDGPPKGETFRK